MSSIYEKIDNSIETFLSTLKRFPFASFSAFLFTIIVTTVMDYHEYSSPNVIIAFKVAFVATLGIILFPALQLLGRSIIFPIIGLILIISYYYILPHNLEDMTMSTRMRHILLMLALFFMIFWVPYVGRKSNNDNFWQYAQSIIFGLITAILFSAIVYAGLATALYAIEKLFYVDIRSIYYGQLALIIFGIFGINFFLSQIPKQPLLLAVRPYSKVEKIFSQNILAPIAIMYFIILFIYTAKILITSTWPTSILSLIIIAFSMVTILSFLFLTPYLKQSTKTQRLMWLAIFLQTIMLGMALCMRIEEYGISYNRYLLAMFGLWLGLMSLYFILFGKAQQKWLFFFASVFIFISQFGPYSAKNITEKSQTTRLIKLIETAHPISEELDIKKKYQISNSLEYINRQCGTDSFEKILPDILKKYKLSKGMQKQNKGLIHVDQTYMYDFPSFATQELGFKLLNKWEYLNDEQNNGKKPIEDYYFYASNLTESIDIRDYKHLINYHYNQRMYSDTKLSKKINKYPDLNLSISLINNELQIQENEQNISSFHLNNYVEKLLKQPIDEKGNTQKELSYEGKENNLSIKILFQRLVITSDGNISDFSSQILLKR